MPSASNAPDLAFPKFPAQLSLGTPEVDYATFVRQVWARDGGRNRANGEPLSKHDDRWRYLGNVCHLVTKGAHPEWRLIVANGVLLSHEYHRLSDARGNNRLLLLDPESGERATDANRKILFVMRDLKGTVLWQRVR